MKLAVKFWPAALAEMSQSVFGIVSLPPVSYGPCTLSLIGPFSCLMPLRSSVSSRSTFALLIGVENALSSVSLTSLELLPPQAARSDAISVKEASRSVRKVRDIGGQPSRPPLKSAQHGPSHNPLHGQGRRRQDKRRRRHRAILRARRPADDRAVHRSCAFAVGFARRRARQRADTVRRSALGPGGPGAGRDGAPLGRGSGMARRVARRARRRPHLRRRADRAARHGRAPLPSPD